MNKLQKKKLKKNQMDYGKSDTNTSQNYCLKL